MWSSLAIIFFGRVAPQERHERVDGAGLDDRGTNVIIVSEAHQRQRGPLLTVSRAAPHERHERVDGAGLDNRSTNGMR